MAAYSYGSSYESVMKKNCGYRQLGNYYNNLFDNVTSDDQDKNKIIVIPEFGQVGYNKIENFSRQNLSSSSSATNGNNQQCNTWRMGQCCDGRSLSKDAYTQCADGLCGYYKDTRNTNQLYSRY
jgi:hypothetical protein